jgi:hypothetical protein
LEDAAIGCGFEYEVNRLNMRDTNYSTEALTPGPSPGSFTLFRTGSRRGEILLPDGVEDEGEADVGRGEFSEEFVEEGGDGGAGGVGVEFDCAFDRSVVFVPGGGLGDADQVLDGGVFPEGGVVDEDGFAVEEAGGPGGLEGLRGDFNVGGGVG